MDKRKVAMELIKIAKDLISAGEVEALEIADDILVKKNFQRKMENMRDSARSNYLKSIQNSAKIARDIYMHKSILRF